MLAAAPHTCFLGVWCSSTPASCEHGHAIAPWHVERSGCTPSSRALGASASGPLLAPADGRRGSAQAGSDGQAQTLKCSSALVFILEESASRRVLCAFSCSSSEDGFELGCGTACAGGSTGAAALGSCEMRAQPVAIFTSPGHTPALLRALPVHTPAWWLRGR